VGVYTGSTRAAARKSETQYDITLALILFVVIMISGCQSFIKLQAWPPPYSLPAGSTIVINQELSVAENSVSVWIQYGEVVDRKDIDVNYAHCYFELYSLQSIERVIKKDIVTIRKFVNTREYVYNGALLYASLAQVNGDSGAPMAEIYTTNIYLQSDKQPDLYRLVCALWEDPASGRYLTVNQIQEALGNIVTLRQSE
jgi:hypothetical protein